MPAPRGGPPRSSSACTPRSSPASPHAPTPAASSRTSPSFVRQVAGAAPGDQLDAAVLPPNVDRQEVRRRRWASPAAVTVTIPLTSEERLLRAVDVATILSVPAKRVYELGIPAVRLSPRCLRWRRVDINRWLDERRISL